MSEGPITDEGKYNLPWVLDARCALYLLSCWMVQTKSCSVLLDCLIPPMQQLSSICSAWSATKIPTWQPATGNGKIKCVCEQKDAPCTMNPAPAQKQTNSLYQSLFTH